MKFIRIVLILLVLPTISVLAQTESTTSGFAQTEIIEPGLRNGQRAFAIFIDRTTFDHTEDAVFAYKRAVEADGLPTYVVVGAFTSPEAVKESIHHLYNRPQSLEGVVFVGEIPIVKIRNAQHMTTAFKMDEEAFPIEQSSVPSDRFYDDFNLTFDYLQQDENNPLIHYYKLREDSPQKLSPTIYSARIRYPNKKGGNPYEAIRNYLYKVANTQRNNLLDHLVAFTGVAYNSECLVAWKDDAKAYQEDFPFLGSGNTHFRQLNYRMAPAMKYVLFDEMQREEVDVLLMRKHGTPTQELISRESNGDDVKSQLEEIRRYFSTMLRRARNNHMDVDSLINVYSSNYGLADSFFTNWDSEENRFQDSLIRSEGYIHTADLNGKTIHPLYVILDACYNGSFDEDDYIAGHYIFSNGNTIAAQGNTRNVLQDTWSMNLTGLLSYGVRLGWVHNLNPTLENHLIGDPTFHFANPGSEDLNHALSARNNETSYWRALLKTENPVYQSLALRMLAEGQHVTADQLLRYFNESPFHTVRLQALYLLSDLNGPQFREAIANGLTDGYEMIARQSAIFAKKNGHDSLIPAITRAYTEGSDRLRVIFNLETGFNVFDEQKLQAAMPGVLKEEVTRMANAARGHEMLLDPAQNVKDRISQARRIRNSNFHRNVPDYLRLIGDHSVPVSLRVVLAEALGWFNHSYRKEEIIQGLTRVRNDKNIPEELKLEIQQTLIRLQS